MDHVSLVSNLAQGMRRQYILLSMLVALCLLFGANFVIAQAPQKLGLVPVSTTIAHSYIWNLVTSSFYETNVIKLTLDIFGTVLVGANMEVPASEQIQFYVFFFGTIIICTIGASAWSFMRFFVMHDQNQITHPIYGFAGVLMSVIMYQRMRYKNVPVYALVPYVTYDNLPFIVLTTQIVCRLLGLRFLTRDLIFSVISVHAAWAYLRYFYVKDDGSVGDKSDDFAYYKLVPPLLQPITLPLITAFCNIIALTGLFPVIETTTKTTSPIVDHLGRTIQGSAGGVGGTGSTGIRQADVVSERRRAKAIKLLEARLQQEPSGWGDDATTTGGSSSSNNNKKKEDGSSTAGATNGAPSNMLKV